MTGTETSPPDALHPSRFTKRRSKTVYFLWAGALTALIAAGLLCWKIAVPYLRTRAIVKEVDAGTLDGYAEAVRRLGGPAAAARDLSLFLRLPGQSDEFRFHAIEMLGHCGSRTVPRLIELLASHPPQERWAAASALAEIGPEAAPAVPALLKLLRDRGAAWRARSRAARALGKIKDPAAVEPLLAMLRDPQGQVRYGSARALGMIGDKRAFEPLVETLKNDKDSRVRRGAADALVDLGDPRAIAPLDAAVKGAGLNWSDGLWSRLNEMRKREEQRQ